MRRLDWLNRVNFIDIYAAEQCPLDPAQLLERFHAQRQVSPSLMALPPLLCSGDNCRFSNPWAYWLDCHGYCVFWSAPTSLLRIRPRLQLVS